MKQLIIDWNYTPLLPKKGEEGFVEERKVMEEKSYAFINKYRKDKKFLEDSNALKEALDGYNELAERYLGGGNESYYYGLRSEIEQDNPDIRAKLNKIEEFAIRIGNDMNFFELELAKVSEEKQKEFLASPSLAPYKHFLERLFAQAKYMLSEKEERIMSMKSQTAFGNWVDMLERFLSKEEREILTSDGKKEKKNFSEIITLMSDKNKEVRDDAAGRFNEILDKLSDVAEAEMNSVLQDKKVNDELRGLAYPEEARLLADDIDKDVVDALVSVVSKHFDIAQRYYALKAKLFGVKKLAYHERNLEYGNDKNVYEYDASVDLVKETLGNIDSEFAEIMEYFASNGFYDVYPKKGKKSGAFCAGYLSSQPTYIMLNHTGKLNDVLTLAHETGHGINNELTRKKQNAINFGTFTSTAEVASTFTEDFVLQRLLQDATDEQRLTIMVQKMDDFVSTIFRQVAFYLFEKVLHSAYRERGYLTKDEIGSIFAKHMHAYMGDAVEMSTGSQNWWMYVGHFRRFFYVYSYASGLLISKAMQHGVKEDKAFVAKVKEFLSAGTSASPKEVFAHMGIDISQSSFWEKGVEEVEEFMEYLEALHTKLTASQV